MLPLDPPYNHSHLTAQDHARRILWLLALLTPLWWMAGFQLLIYQCVSLATLGYLTLQYATQNRLLSISFPAKCMLLIGGLYAFSIALHAPEYATDRIFAACNNLSMWCMGIALIVLLGNTFERRHLAPLLRLFPIFAACSLILLAGTALFAAQGMLDLVVRTPMAYVVGSHGDSALLHYSVRMRLIVEDYLMGQAVPRLMLFSPYPTASGAFFMICIPFYCAWGAATGRLRKPLFWLLLVPLVAGLGCSFARTAIVGLLASTVLVVLLERRHAFTLVALGFLLLLLASPGILHLADSAVTMREGSSMSRFSLYQESISLIEGHQWLVGRGIRVPSVTQRMPLGSHSTLVSLLYRTGILGLATYLTLQAHLFYRWLKAKPNPQDEPVYRYYWRACGIVFFSMALWTVTEDIDAPQLIAFLYFSLIGTFTGLNRQRATSAYRFPRSIHVAPTSTNSTWSPACPL